MQSPGEIPPHGTLDVWRKPQPISEAVMDTPLAKLVEPAFYKTNEAEIILSLDYQTLYRLAKEGILVKCGRGKGTLWSAKSIHALVDWMERGGDKWQAPKMRNDQPAAPAAPEAKAASGKTRKPAAGGMRSASMGSSASTGRVTSKPPLRVLNSLKKSWTTE